MALTPQEQAELDSLQKEAVQMQPQAKPTGLTPQEQQELAQLQGEAQQLSAGQERQGQVSANRQDLAETAQAGLTGVARGATLGYLPQIVAGASKAIDYLTPESEVDKQLKARGFSISAPQKTYAQYRDEQSALQAQQQETHPVATFAGEMAGGLVPLAASPISALGKGASLGSKLAYGAKTGALFGAAVNPGETTGEVSPVQFGERLKSTAIGAAIGPAVELGTAGIGQVGSKISSAGKDLAALAQEKAFKSLGPTASDVAKKFQSKGVNLGRFMLDNNLIKPGDNVQKISERALEAKNAVGDAIGGIYQDAGAMAENIPGTKIDIKQMADDFRAGLEHRQYGNPEEEQTINHVVKVLNNISKKGEVSLSEAHKTRQQLDGMINWGKTSGTVEPEKLAEMKNLRNELQARMEDSLKITDESMGTSFHSSVKNLNSQYGPLKDISSIGAKGAGRASAARTFGASEQIAAATGMVAGGPIAAVKLAAGSGVLKRYADPIVATAANKVSGILERNPEALGRFGKALISAAEESPDAFIGALTLATKNDKFKRQVEIEGEPRFPRNGQ